MKSLFTTFFALSSLILFGQITGNVFNENDEPIEFATILNLNKKTSSITNVDGFFILEGQLGDSIRIQHLSYNRNEFKVHSLENEYILNSKSVQLGEITVTPKYAINLFKKSCLNTFDKFDNNNTVRAYFQYLSTINMDTSQIINLDLDVVQKKYKKIEKGEKLIPYKIQERNEFKPKTPFCANKPFLTHINQIYNWATYLNNSRHFKSLDSLYLKLYFIGEKQRIEVVIQRIDSCLVSVTGYSTAPLKTKTGKQLSIEKLYWIIKYAHIGEIAYLSEMTNILILNDPRNENNVLTFKQFYKTYESNLGRVDRRPNGHRMFDNLWEPRFIKNKYEKQFWKSISYEQDIESINTTFAGLKLQSCRMVGNRKITKAPLIKAYGIGIHK